MEHLGVSSETIDISALALQAFQEMGHAPFGIDCRGLDVESFRAALARVPSEARQDLTFENVQARLRTFLLMSKGFVVGTGDLSELALGWSTYNGDHMSMYNPNCSIPKTLVQVPGRVCGACTSLPDGPVRQTLLSIVETTISPELLPASTAGEIEQSTEATLGPYELHDFILYHAIRCGYSPAKILFMSQFATFSQPYSRELIERTMRTFYTPVFPPAVQAVVHPRRAQGRHGQPLAARRLANALRRRSRRVAEMPGALTPLILSSRQQLLADLGLSFGADQLLVQPLIGVRELPGVEAQQVEDRGLEVVDADRVVGDVCSPARRWRRR